MLFELFSFWQLVFSYSFWFYHFLIINSLKQQHQERSRVLATYGYNRSAAAVPIRYICLHACMHAQCPTPCNPMDCGLPGSSVHGILHSRILEWIAISFSRGIFLTQGSNLGLLHCQADSLPLSHQRSSAYMF